MPKTKQDTSDPLGELALTMASQDASLAEIQRAEQNAINAKALSGVAPRLWLVIQKRTGDEWSSPRIAQVFSMVILEKTVLIELSNGETYDLSNFPYEFENRPDLNERTVLCGLSERLSAALGWGDPVFAWVIGYKLD